ncbi:hypothetical protein FA95DRAFT_1598684 [Auriscalpium vulgare]|uniref:Uncharacterized protein n=1 Tax=Auriscalpium vulgare TaxID=40419 RepID=A0ACB8RE72_9AGAM|nr:hypothetical protein FA95DRAFT_1598684 [Auriscalpium vulgare]
MQLSGVVTAAAALLALSQIDIAGAQTSPLACNSGWEWTYNSLGQTPCEVYAHVDQACEDAESCVCTPPLYALASACDACQDHYWFDWDDWYFDHNCTVIELDVTVPSTTSIPQWAYADINATDPTWNIDVAKAIAGDSSETTATATLPSPTISFVPNPDIGSHHGLSRGAKAAIAGGVVGGVFALLAVLLLVNRRRTRAEGAGFRERVRARYFDMKVGARGLENVRMHEGPFNQAVVPPPEKPTATSAV